MNAVVQLLMNKLQNSNPKSFQAIQLMMNNGQSPEGMVKQMMSSMTTEQKQNILKQAKSYGCPNEILSKIQNMK